MEHPVVKTVAQRLWPNVVVGTWPPIPSHVIYASKSNILAPKRLALWILWLASDGVGRLVLFTYPESSMHLRVGMRLGMYLMHVCRYKRLEVLFIFMLFKDMPRFRVLREPKAYHKISVVPPWIVVYLQLVTGIISWNVFPRVVLELIFFGADSTLTHMTIQVTQLRFNSNPKFANLTQLWLN